MRYKKSAKFDMVMPVTQDQSLSEEGLVCVLKAPRYVCTDLVGESPKMMRSVLITFDIDAGFNLIRESFLTHGWQKNLLTDVALPSLGDANGNRIPFSCFVELRLRFGNLVYRMTFYVCKRLKVSMISGKPSMNRHVRAIRCMEQYIELARGGKLLLLAQGNSSQELPGMMKHGVDNNFEEYIEGDDGEREAKSQLNHKERPPIGLM